MEQRLGVALRIQSLAAALCASSWRREQVQRFQSRRLRELVRHAYESVPFYRDLYQRNKLQPDDIRGLEDLSRIPIARREEMQERPRVDLVARGLDPARLVVHRTSGSTGFPFSTYRTVFEERLLQGLRLKEQFKLGLRPTDVRVSVAVHGHGSRGERPDTHFYNRLGLLRKPVVDCLLPAQEILRQVAGLRPDILTGYPDALAWIAGEASEEHRRKIRPRFILTGGETLTPDMRQRISDCFSARVYDAYGIHEFNLLAFECAQTGLYHVMEAGALVEVLKEGRPAAAGESGEVVATALHSFAMPMIRYWTGDLAVRGPVPCPCGSPYATLERIQGRVIDRFTLPDGTKLHPYHLLEPLVKEAPWLRRYQLVQEQVDRIVLKMVPLPGVRPDQSQLERLRAGLERPLGAGVDLVMELVESLPSAGNGKFRPYYSLVRDGSSCPAPGRIP